MAISDLMEDHKIVGGFRLALDLNNNSYLLKYQNLKRRVDKEFMVQRQAQQGSIGFGLAKLHTHLASFRLSYPFSELASLRASISAFCWSICASDRCPAITWITRPPLSSTSTSWPTHSGGMSCPTKECPSGDLHR